MHAAKRLTVVLLAVVLMTPAIVDAHGRPLRSSKAGVSHAVAAADGGGNAPALRRKPRGGSGTIINSGFLADIEHNPALRGSNWYGAPGRLGIAAKMVRHAHVRASVSYVADPLEGAAWKFVSPTKDPRDIECAAFCNWAFIESMPFDLIVRAIVQGYMPYGFSLHEVLDDALPIPAKRFPLHPGAGMGIVPTAFEERPAWTVHQWVQSKANTNRLAGVRQMLTTTDAEEGGIRYIPADRLLRVTWDQEGANFAGLAPLRSAYPPWKLMLALQSIDAIKHERTGVGVPTVTLPEGEVDAQEVADVEAVLAAMRANERGYAVFPGGYVFKWEGAGEDKVSNIHLAIQRCQIDIAFNVIAGHRLLGLSGGGSAGGSYALAYTQEGGHHLHIAAHAKRVAAAFNFGSDGWSPVARIARLNYGDDVSVPKLVAGALPTRNWQDVIKTALEGVNKGVIRIDDTLESTVRELLDLPQHDPATARGGELASNTGGAAGGDAPVHDPDVDQVDVDDPGDGPVDDPAAAAPDDTTPKDQQTIFGYHLQNGVVEINEARANLGLEAKAYGNQTVPEYLATVNRGGGGAAEGDKTDDAGRDDAATTEEDPA